MPNILIKIIGNAYSHTNDDAYHHMISYICKKNYFGGYGFFPATPCETIIQHFQSCETCSLDHIDKKMWHFIISTQDNVQENQFAFLADQIALLFASEYQCIYGLDFDKGHPHIHVAVNTHSYHPTHPALTQTLFEQYITQVQSLITRLYTNTSLSIQWEGAE